MKTALEHLDDQLVQVRNAVSPSSQAGDCLAKDRQMDEAKQSDEMTRTQALKDMYAKKKGSAQDKASAADQKTGTFKLVTDRESQVSQQNLQRSRLADLEIAQP